ncbi:hypothetical protein N7509_006163 [Penicillium cosmopolitanum]|uniref:Anaphase spindle elongation protein 1 n=1 Tax=Penicillium cosmopolitanum TaxID=1131564 RepID=A0A9W9W3Q8_9EURO|nr:uncharacterized protein N7509_006163 [Penicillium cosmopolitanum]KAJ5398050.1 hypothetical protein N7509_006163 [Penicillium cosmopolitanum]
MAVDTSYLTTQVNNIVEQLHGIFDDIGVPARERDSREAELFSALSETLNNHLKIVDEEKEELTLEAQRLITAIQQMEASLGDERANGQYELNRDDLRVTYPLNRCIAFLREKSEGMSKLHRERFEQVKKLVDALESYSSHLETSFLHIELPPTAPGSTIPPSFDLSPSYVTALDSEFTRVYEEYHRRVSYVQTTSEEIIKLWAELGTPQVQTDSNIVKCYRESPEQLGLHEADLGNLMARRDKLVEEKKGRERKIKEIRTNVESLWERFGVEEADRKAFLATNRGCGLRTINEFEEELARLNELKRQNMHLFVEDARCRLQELWDTLFFSEEEMLDFTPAFSDVCSDALLEAHEAEIARLETLKEQRAPTLEMIDRHRGILSDREALSSSSQDASRLMARGNKGERRDPGKLLREEKMRKRIAKELPKLEADLRRELERWEDEYGRPFLVHGDRYLDSLTPAPASRMPPPRSKTPSAPPSTTKSSTARQPVSRPGSSMRGPPPPRSATKTPNGSGPVKHNTIGYSGARLGAKSPTKLPARAPLSNMPHGNNSPERRNGPGNYSSSTVNSKMAPPRGPPPRMRALTVESKDRNSHLVEPPRCNSAMSSAFVRPLFSHVQPPPNWNLPLFSLIFVVSIIEFVSKLPPRQPLPFTRATSPALRQTSSSSAGNTTISGSENWETFDDASDGEADTSDVYYGKIRAAHGKRFAPDDSMDFLGKKSKGIRSVSPDGPHPGQVLRVAGSDSEWADEFETY